MTSDDRDRRIDYVELPSADLDRSRRFYGEAFGWRFTDYGPDYLAFDDGRLEGGFARSDRVAATRGGPLVILYAADLDAMAASIERAGGTILRPAYSFPGGRRFHFADPDGHELAVWSET